jgi:hypothetical protein
VPQQTSRLVRRRPCRKGRTDVDPAFGTRRCTRTGSWASGSVVRYRHRVSYVLAVWEGNPPTDDQAALKTYHELMARWHGPDMVPDLDARSRGEQALLQHWPDLTTEEGVDSPWSDGPLINNATGPLFYFGMVRPKAEVASDYAARVAAEHGLVCFDPQTQRMRP